MTTGSAHTGVGVVILSWNALDFTKRCLESLFSVTDYSDLDVVVVDNGSSDGTVEWLRSTGHVRVVANDRNLGFTAGVNQGLREIGPARDALLMNNDMLVTQPDWIGRLRECAYEHEDTGIVGCRQVDGSGRLLHAGSYVTPIAMGGEQIAGGEVDIGQYTLRRPVDSIVGSVMYLRRDMLDVVGGLHPEYFSYFEDTDLCYEAREHGFQTWYCGDVTLVHFQNVSTAANKADMWSMFESSRTVFKRRWGAKIQGLTSSWPLEIRARWTPGCAAEKIALALHEEGVAVRARSGDDTAPESNHPLIRDLGERAGTDTTPLLVVADDPVRSTAPRRRSVVLLETEAAASTLDLRDWSELWVPSKRSRDQVEARHAGAVVRVVPFGVDRNYFHPGILRLRMSDADFRFVVVGPWDEDVAQAVDAFRAEFRRSEPVLLHVHIPQRGWHHGDMIPGTPPTDAGRVVVTANADLGTEGRPGLLKAADAVIVPADPYDPRRVLEPAALGVPTVPVTAALAQDLRALRRDPAGAVIRAREAAREAVEHDWAEAAEAIMEFLRS